MKHNFQLLVFLLLTPFFVFSQKVTFTPFIQSSHATLEMFSEGMHTDVIFSVIGNTYDKLEFGGRFDLRLLNNPKYVISIGAHNRTIRTNYLTIESAQIGMSPFVDQSPISNTKDYISPFVEFSYQFQIIKGLTVQPVAGLKWLTEIQKNKDTELNRNTGARVLYAFNRTVENAIKSNHAFFSLGANLNYRRYGFFIRYDGLIGNSITDDIDDGGIRRSFVNDYRVSTLGLSFLLFGNRNKK